MYLAIPNGPGVHVSATIATPSSVNSTANVGIVSSPSSLSVVTTFGDLAGMELAATPRARSQQKRAVSHAEILTIVRLINNACKLLWTNATPKPVEWLTN